MVLYALGWYTPAFEFMHSALPGVDLFRRPADACFLIGALLAILAGYALHRLVTEPDPERLPIAACAWLLGGTAAGASIGLAVQFGRLPQALPALGESLLSLLLAALVLG
ncbi:MAG: hypothetical protein RLZZ487_2335, partial [Pseudomonadota bacterium]